MDKNSIEAIKLSGDMAAVIISVYSEMDETLFQLCQAMAKNEINLSCLTYSGRLTEKQACFCVRIEDMGQTRNCIEKVLAPESAVEYIYPANLVSVFYHKFNFKMPGGLLNIFQKGGIRIYGLMSSMSSLTFIIARDQKDAALEAIKEYTDIGESQIYFVTK